MSDRNAIEYRRVVASHVSSIAGRKLSEITPERVKAAAGKVSSPSQSNKVKAIISAVFNWAHDEGITGQANPAQAIKSKAIPSRERFLLPSEFPRFMAAVEASPLRDFFLLALFTGARRSNLQAMRWQDLSLEESTWSISRTKNGDPQTIALPPEAVEIIKARKAGAILSAVYVFPGVGKTGHLVEPKRAWDQILETAGLENLRIHDLRRILGSWQARQGASLSIIGKSLGHRSQQATAIYSRLDLDPVRASVEQAAAAMVEAGKAKNTLVSLPIKRL
jgi:integrase